MRVRVLQRQQRGEKSVVQGLRKRETAIAEALRTLRMRRQLAQRKPRIGRGVNLEHVPKSYHSAPGYQPPAPEAIEVRAPGSSIFPLRTAFRLT